MYLRKFASILFFLPLFCAAEPIKIQSVTDVPVGATGVYKLADGNIWTLASASSSIPKASSAAVAENYAARVAKLQAEINLAKFIHKPTYKTEMISRLTTEVKNGNLVMNEKGESINISTMETNSIQGVVLLESRKRNGQWYVIVGTSVATVKQANKLKETLSQATGNPGSTEELATEYDQSGGLEFTSPLFKPQN